ncbi:MAG: TIGR01906 family membrane protein [bacterium]|jgi:integral membrane protein (TIGR01906 family)
MGGNWQRFFSRLMVVVIGLLLLLVVLLSSLEIVAFDLKHYRNQYSILGQAEKLGMTEAELLRVTGEMLAYLKGARDDLAIEATINGEKVPFFSQREIAHMVDVRRLFATGFLVRNVAGWLLAVLFGLSIILCNGSWREGLIISLNRSALLALLLLLLTALIISTDFAFWFDQFHFLSFDNDLWLLDPLQHNLIKLVPQTFFQNTARVFTIRALSTLLFLSLASGWYLYKQKGKVQDDLRASTSRIP